MIFFQKKSCRIPVENTLNELQDKEKNKKKRKKMQDLRLTEYERETIKAVLDALKIVKKGSERLCANHVTLSIADKVS